MGMKVTIFDVEHGACAFIRTPGNHTVLIDCGRTDDFSPALYLAQNELNWTWNGKSLTKLIITHPHDDHIKDIETVTALCPPALLHRQRYDWEEVKTAENGDYEKLDAYTDWQATYNGTPAVWPHYGMSIESFMLSPMEAKRFGETKYLNNSSIVTVATFQGATYQEKFLFGGDMETAGWEALLHKSEAFRNAVKDVDFFIVSHHGHLSGSSELLYATMGRRPILNIVSIHHNDEHIDPRYSQEAYAIGTQVDGTDRRMLTTRTDGTITINVSDAGQFSIDTERLAPNRLRRPAASGW